MQEGAPNAIVIDDRFEIRSRVAAGGMGVVYLAFDRITGEHVALKLLQSSGGDLSTRFLREAQILAELKHPAIVRYVAHGTAGAGGERYLAMEWLAGEDLSARLAAGPLAVAEAAALVATVAEALVVAHDKGAIHRDLKPGNLFLPGGSTAHPKLLDFGIARLLGDTQNLTQMGAAIGTPAYMSPEQVRGGPIDVRSDLFSLGCVLFECLAGCPPWSGGSAMAVMAKIMFDQTPRLRKLRPEVPLALEKIVDRLLEKDRSLRYPNARGAAAELRALLRAGLPAPDAPCESLLPPSLTQTEQRLVCVVLVEGGARTRIEIETRDEAAAIAAAATVVASAPSQRVFELAEAHGARLEELLDGSIVAVLAGAVSATDLCVRAARFSLALSKAVPGRRIALATGRAVVSDVLPTGDAIESAAALLTAVRSEASGVYLDPTTASLLDASFRIERAAAALVLTEEHRSLDQTRQLLGMPTPCVGRSRELAELSALLHGCFAERRARAAVITGAAGVGKSRIRHELLTRLRAEGRAEIWIARGDPMRKGSPLGMLAQAIRRAAEIRDGEPPEESFTKLRARAAAAGSPEDQARIAEFLGEIVGVPFPGGDRLELCAARQNAMLMADQMLRAWEELLLAACARRPVVLVLEDLQWGDLPTTKFVDAALRNARERPFFVFALARPEVDEVFPGLWSARGASRLALGELPRDASEQLVRAVIGDAVKPATLARLVDQAAGNAFYLEELIRAVAEGHGEDHLPGSVVAMAQARIEALPEAQRRALRAGSVFGETFWLGGVASLLGVTEPEARVVATTLVEREVALERAASPGSRPGEREYVFRHSLMREAAYGMLTDHDRALGHRLAAEWLLGAGETDAFVLAQHFDRGGEPARAAEAYGGAAEQALEANDLEAVLDRAWKAARCGAKGEALARLRLLEATAYHWLAQHAHGEQAATRAIRGLRPLSPAWYRAVEEVAEASLPLGKTQQLVVLAQALHPPPGRGAPADAFVVTAATVAMQVFLAGRYEEAESVMARLASAEGRILEASPLVGARVHFARATRAMIRGDLGMVLEQARAAVTAFDKAGDLRSAALMRTNLAYAYIEIGGYHDAEAALRSAATVAERIGLPHVVAAAKQNLGWALARQGALDEARVVEGECIDLYVANSERRMEGIARIYMAVILTLAGDLDGALAQVNGALAVLKEIPPVRAYALGALAHVLLERGRAGEALAAATAATDLLEELGSLDEGEALVRLTHARALSAHGDVEAARRAIGKARAVLLARAEKISDKAWSERFLRQVPENARTLALAGALG